MRTPNTILKDSHVVKRPKSKLVPLVEPNDTIFEQPIDDLPSGVEQVVIGDWFQKQNFVFKGG